MWIVEHYRPQRVMQQFGAHQRIPSQGKCEYNHLLEKMTNGRGGDWPTVHARYVQDWEFEKWQYWTNNSEKFKRRAYNPDRHFEYMEWYGRVSEARLVQSTISHDTDSYRPLVPDKRKAMENFTEACEKGLKAIRKRWNGAKMRSHMLDMLGCMRKGYVEGNEYPSGLPWHYLDTPNEYDEDSDDDDGGNEDRDEGIVVSQLTQEHVRGRDMRRTSRRGAGRGVARYTPS